MSQWQPLWQVPSRHPIEKEQWENDLYVVFKNPHAMQAEGVPDIPMVWLSIKRIDQSPLIDWRHLQFIKNQLVGPGCEAVQIFPKESKMIDGANQFHLWCWPDPRFTLPFGFNEGRLIAETAIVPGSKQRPWPDNMKPEDLAEQQAKTEIVINKHLASQGKPPIKRTFWVDIPDHQTLTDDEAPWINVATCNTRDEAIKFIQENIDPSSTDGTVNLITEGSAE